MGSRQFYLNLKVQGVGGSQQARGLGIIQVINIAVTCRLLSHGLCHVPLAGLKPPWNSNYNKVLNWICMAFLPLHEFHSCRSTYQILPINLWNNMASSSVFPHFQYKTLQPQSGDILPPGLQSQQWANPAWGSRKSLDTWEWTWMSGWNLALLPIPSLNI